MPVWYDALSLHYFFARGKIAFRRGNHQLEYLQWREAYSVEWVLLPELKTDQLQLRTV